MTITETRPTRQEPTRPAPPAPPPPRNRSWLILAGAWLGGIALIVSMLAIAIAAIGAGETDDTTGGASEGGAPVTFDIELGDLYVKPASVDVRPGQEVTLNVTNKGAIAHDLKVDGTTGTKMLDPGASETIKLGSFDKSTQAWCTVPGHKEAGMLLDINVKGAAAGADTEAEASKAAVIDPQAKPAADWKPFDPRLQPAAGGTEHKIQVDAVEKVMEVAPGVEQKVWTFNGTVPGPVFRGKVGDVFTMTLTNKGEVDHSIDFHASKVAWNDEMRSIKPGESLVYQFEAKHAGIFMYHCGTPPALHHIGNGMYGALIVDPPNLPAVDHEFAFVQSELYLGAQGKEMDLKKMQGDDWDAVIFNGYFNQYATAPIRVEPGQRIRAWVLDAGPSENASFHIVGTVFDTMFKEGAYTLRPGSERGGAQALDLQPAQGGFVEFTFDEAGLYPIVTHKFSNVGKGALGLFQAGEVHTAGAGGH